jgi:hypothetical protein
MDVIKVIMMQEKKKGVQKVIGELRILVATLQKNDRNEAWLPLSGEKAKTVGDIRLKIHYAVDIILPTLEYNPFLKVRIDVSHHKMFLGLTARLDFDCGRLGTRSLNWKTRA